MDDAYQSQQRTVVESKGCKHTWTIPYHVAKNQPFSKFRLFQFGPNLNSYHYLPCSEFEIYVKVVSGIDAPREETASNATNAHSCTNGGERQWTNTIDLRLINVDASSLMNDSAPLSALCGLASVRCMTKHHQKSLMSIEFKDVKIRLSHYKLRNYKSRDKEALRFLVLEGSDDGISWILLRQHADDKALRKARMAHKRPPEMSQYLMFLHKCRLFLIQFQKSSKENIM
ncbi:hypothetical protein RFI_22785, partial [Reticulomyxa filosa]